jgi:alkylation response protein AidB-like acyl-CoA dehydrogenase
VDFRLDERQLALQETVAEFCASRYGFDGLGPREAATEESVRRDWHDLSDLGVFSILVPEANGGLGLDVVHAALVFEQLGRHLVTGPLLWSAVGAALLADPPSPALALSGFDASVGDAEPIVVEHADRLDALVVLRPSGVHLVDRSELGEPEPLDPLDPLTPVGRYGQVPAGTPIGGPEDATSLRRRGTVLSSALLVGVAQSALDVARDYSLERQQFDRPIGSFQALKHMMADMYVKVALARSSAYAAAAVLDDPSAGDLDDAASAAKLLAGEAAVENARAAVQILGGMGFTWEMPTNYLLKRAWVLDQSFGTSSAHALAISDSLAGAGR